MIAPVGAPDFTTLFAGAHRFTTPLKDTLEVPGPQHRCW